MPNGNTAVMQSMVATYDPDVVVSRSGPEWRVEERRDTSVHDLHPNLAVQTRLGTWFADAAQFIARHVAEPQVFELPGVGHFAPVLEPESIADELITFFASVRQPA